MKKIPVIFISLLLGASSLWAQQVKRIVNVDKAVVYAEPNENSYKIDTVRRGEVLTLFEKGIETSDWLYVAFRSKRWKGEVTGFIKKDLVVTEEEMLREDQRRMEEEEAAQKRRREDVEEKTESETEAGAKAEEKAEAGAKPKPADELPDLRAAFAKKKPEPEPEQIKPEAVETKPKPEQVKPEPAETKPVPEPIKPEPKEAKPEPAEIQAKEEEVIEEAVPVPEEKAEVKEAEPVATEPKVKAEVEEREPPPPVVTITDGITESPQGRSFALYQAGVMAEDKPYAIIMREFKPPPMLVKAEEKVVEEAPAELQADVMPMKEETPPPEEEEKDILEKTPQSIEIATPKVEIAEEAEFKRPEPPPPIVTVIDSVTDSPRNRSIQVAPRPEFIEMMVYKFVEIEPPEPEKPEVREVRTEKTVNPEENEAPPPPVDTKEKEEEKEEVAEEPQAGKPTEQEVKPPTQTVKPPEQVVRPPEQVVQPTELPQPKQPVKEGLLSFSIGYGPSWGGFGGTVQLKINKNISIHLGGGMYPTKSYYSEYDWATNKWLYSIGIKYYLPLGSENFRTYVDLMYGGIAVEAVQLVKEIWYYEYTYENIQKVLYGPSFVAGADLKLGFLGLTGYLGLSYNTTAWDYWDRDYFLNGGLGIFLFF